MLEEERDARETVGRVSATDLDITLQAVPIDQVVTGSPSTGVHPLGVFGDHEVGVWQMTPGSMSDTEADELFVVLAGRATIEFVDTGTWMLIGPGDIVRLTAGTRTVWTVTESLRKFYVA